MTTEAKYAALRAALRVVAVAGPAATAGISSKRLGHWLKSVLGTRVGGRFITRRGLGGINRYRLNL